MIWTRLEITQHRSVPSSSGTQKGGLNILFNALHRNVRVVRTHNKDIGIFLFKALNHFNRLMETLSADKIHRGISLIIITTALRCTRVQNNGYLIMSNQPELSREENHLTSDTQKSVELSVKGKRLNRIYTRTDLL